MTATRNDVLLVNTPTSEDELVEQLIEVGRLSDERGLISASGGNLSGRLPNASTFIITATGTWLGSLRPEDFTIMNLDGEVVGGAPQPSSEYKVHLFTYRARADVNSIVHLHPQTTVLVDALGAQIRPLTLDQASYLRTIERIGFFPNGSDDLGEHAARAAARSNIIVMAHHGCSSLGDTVGMAYRRALNLEDAARVTYQALAVGRVDTEFPEEFLPEESGGTV